MKKKGLYGILILILAIVFVMALATVVFAGGYNPYTPPTDKYTIPPHGDGTGAFYNTSTNYCKTCHAVHLAGLVTPSGGYEPGYDLGDSWRLLRATSAEDACKFCHEGASPHTNKNAYPLTGTPAVVMGEHSIDNTGADPVSVGPATGEIPDSSKGTLGATAKTKGSFAGGDNLTCNKCHSVHGANIIPGEPILRKDPYGDGGDVTVDGLPYKTDTGTIAYATSPEAKRAAFCGDCHNLNPNWIISTNDYRVEPHAHPINTDGVVPVNGVPTTVSTNNVLECRTCHEATSVGGGGPSAFPHQSIGHKLLKDSYDPDGADNIPGTPDDYPLDAGQNVNNPQRQLPKMDTLCIACHIFADGGVGISF